MGRRHRYRGRPTGSIDLRGRCVRVSFPILVRQVRLRVGLAIQRARLEERVSAAELAAACGVSVREVHRWELGEINVSIARLKQISIALGVSLEHLLGL